MSITTSPPGPADAQDLFGPLWRRKWLLLVIVVTSTVGTYVASSRQPERFRSSTQFIAASSDTAAIIGGAEANGNDRDILNQAKLVVSKPVSLRVAQRLRLRESPDVLSSTVTATPVVGSDFITVTAERGSGKEASAVANAYVAEYARFRRDRVTATASAALRRLRSRLANLSKRKSADAQRESLQETVRQLQATLTVPLVESRQISPATAGQPFAPRPGRNALFAFAISLGLALALAFGLERFDRRIRTLDEVADAYGVPLLSTIPLASTPADIHDGKAAVPESLREPFRTLRTNLQLASLDMPVKRIVVASAISGEGKSTVVRNLALTYREWGLTVVVLEADLRRPSLSSSFGVDASSGGLTAVLTGECDLDDALVDIDFDIASLDYLNKIRGGTADERPGSAANTAMSTTKLVLLPSGETPPNPQAVLAADRTRLVIDQLSHRFDIVLIDTPPLLAVSDATALLPQSDGVVLVTRVGSTDRRAAQRAVATAQLDPTVRILGVVANGFTFEPGGGYGYGYGYGYDRSNGKTA